MARIVKASFRAGDIGKFTTFRESLRLTEKKLVKLEGDHERRRLTTLRSWIREGGKKGSKLFWSTLKKKVKSSKFISVLENKQKERIISPAGKAKLIEEYFKVKFKTSESKKKLEKLNDVSWLNAKNFMLKDADRSFLSNPILEAELKLVISELKEDKACGLDGVTPQMLINMGPVMENRLLELFNHIWRTGIVPEDWKEGEVVLLPKRPPVTKIENFRPITLFRCTSKLLTKIIAKRLSNVVESSGLVNESQNGFR